MAVRDLSDYFEDGTLEYPGVPSKKYPEGKTYIVRQPDARTGLQLAGMGHLGLSAAFGNRLSATDLASLRLDDEQELDFYQRVLGCSDDCRKLDENDKPGAACGSTYDEMLDDGVNLDWFKKIGEDAFLCFAFDQDFATARLGGQGKAPNRATRRAVEKAGRKSAPASGATATRTRTRASTGSSTRRKPSAAPKDQASA